MKAELRSLHSPDVDDLRSYNPGGAPFSVFVEAMVGIEGASGEESFGFTVCNPASLESQLAAKADSGWHRALLVVGSYDFERIQSAVRALCDGAEADDWKSVARNLSRYTLWEFEDYDPDPK